jgi:hypothetical protein
MPYVCCEGHGLSIVWFMSALCPRQRGEHNVDGITGLSQLGRRLGTIGLEGVANSEHNVE